MSNSIGQAVEAACQDSQLSHLFEECKPLEHISPTQRDEFITQVNNCSSEKELKSVKLELESISIGRGNMYTEKAKNRRQLLNKVYERLDYLQFSTNQAWPVPKETIETLFDYDIPIQDSEKMDYLKWEKFISNHSLYELQFTIEALNKKYSHTHPEKEPENRVEFLTGVLATYPTTSIHPTDVIPVSNRGEGEDAEIVKEYLNQIYHILNPVLGGMLATWLVEITTNKTKKITSRSYEKTQGDGFYSHFNNKINVKDEIRTPDKWTPQSRRDKNWTYSSQEKNRTCFVLAHEICHAVHHLFGIQFPKRTLNQKYGCLEDWQWKPITSSEPTEISSEFKNRFQSLWEEWVANECTPIIRNRQKRTPSEYLAAGFEAFLLNPLFVENTMPKLASFFQEYFVCTPSQKRNK